MRADYIQGDSRESAEVGVFPFIDIDRTYILLLIIDIRYSYKDCHRRAVAVFIFLRIEDNSRVPDINAENLAGSKHCCKFDITR